VYRPRPVGSSLKFFSEVLTQIQPRCTIPIDPSNKQGKTVKKERVDIGVAIDRCECNLCVYDRWYKRQAKRVELGLPAQPKPCIEKRSKDCRCHHCMKSRLRAAGRRCAEYVKELRMLRATVEAQRTELRLLQQTLRKVQGAVC
jgi:hypothetical protein